MRKQRYFILIPIFIFLIVLPACSIKQDPAAGLGPEKIKVAATIFPLYDLVRTVGGEKIDVLLVLEPGASPHTFEATPGKIRALNGTKAFFIIGAGLDAWAEDIAKSLVGSKIIALDRYAKLEPFQRKEPGSQTAALEPSVDDETEAHGQGESDPHYWLNPVLAESLLILIADELGKLDPANREYFQQAAADYAAKIRAEDFVWQKKLDSLASREIVVFHDAWGYFADHFGLMVAASFEPFPGKIPSPAYLVDLQTAVAEHDVKTIFVEPQLSAEALRTLADDLGVRIDVLDPLGGVPGRDTYIDLIDYNVNVIYQANRP